MAHTRQSGPNSWLEFQVKVFKTFEGVLSSLGRWSLRARSSQTRAYMKGEHNGNFWRWSLLHSIFFTRNIKEWNVVKFIAWKFQFDSLLTWDPSPSVDRGSKHHPPEPLALSPKTETSKSNPRTNAWTQNFEPIFITHTRLRKREESSLNLCRRNFKLYRSERGQNEGSTGPARLDDMR